MRTRIIALSLFTSLIVTSLVARSSAASSCDPVSNASTKVAVTPNHSYTNTTGVNGSKTEAETIIANGQKYIQVRGKWIHLPVTSQEILEREKEKDEHGKSTCQLLRNESVNGEAATLYSLHREFEGVTEDGQMWISKASGLLLRVEEDFDSKDNKVKEHRSTRFEYSNVKPPL